MSFGMWCCAVGEVVPVVLKTPRSFKTSGTTCSTTQHHIAEDFDLQFRNSVTFEMLHMQHEMWTWMDKRRNFISNLTLMILKMLCGRSHDFSNIVHSLWGLRLALYNRHTRVGYSLSTFHLKTQLDPASETWGFCWGSWQCPKFHLWLFISIVNYLTQ